MVAVCAVGQDFPPVVVTRSCCHGSFDQGLLWGV